ncbi:MAG: hypothetical protein KF852_03485 [Saprospiraceae bacterium]|nr:hypothetical protein [Saprospiraceae bacterium]
MKNHFSFPFLLAIASVLVWSSCSPTLYIPNMLNTPLAGEKGDFKGTFGTMSKDVRGGSSYELQGSYAPGNNVVVMGSALFMDWGNSPFSTITGGNHRILEGGAGYYTAFGRNEQGFAMGRAEVLGGFGLGSGADSDLFFDPFGNNPNALFRGRYSRIFLQPAVGLRTSIVDVSGAMRISSVNFSDIQQVNGLGSTLPKTPFGFATVEPALTVSVGYKYVKFYMQVRAVSAIVNGENYRQVTNQGVAPTSIGLVGSTWREKPPLHAPIVLEKPAVPKADPPAGEETPPVELSPAVVIPLKNNVVTVCLRDAGSPDGDLVSATLNGVVYLHEAELTRKPVCFDAPALPGAENVLRLLGVSEGRVKPITMEVTVREGRKERMFYLRFGEGETEEIRFEVQE